MCEQCVHQAHFAIGVLTSTEIRILKIMHSIADANDMDCADDIFESIKIFKDYLQGHQKIAGKVAHAMSEEQKERIAQHLTPETMEDAIRSTLSVLQLASGVDLMTAAKNEAIVDAIVQAMEAPEAPDSPFDIPGLSDRDADDLFGEDL